MAECHRPTLRGVIQPAEQFLARDVPPRTWLIESCIPHPSLGMLYAWRGSGKTFTALDFALAVADGGAWMPYRVPTARRVLYVDGEMPLGDLRERIAALHEGRGGSLHNLWICASEDAAVAEFDLDLSREPVRRELAAAMAHYKIEVLILDNWVSLVHGLDENDNAEIDKIKQWLIMLRHGERSVLLIHHAGKGGTQRGASAREDNLDYSIVLEQELALPERSLFLARWDKTRGGLPRPPEWRMLLETDEKGLLRFTLTDGRLCEVCGKPLKADSRATTCSPACRKARNRARRGKTPGESDT